MKIATLLFTYNRSYHTEQVINALKKNKTLPQKLFVFQDGLGKDGDRSEWKKVNNLIHSIDWCDKAIIVSEYHKGLADSIVSGINVVFKEYDAVIVLEDDCVPSANFLDFMQQCFEKYQDNKKVYTVSGYSWPIEIEKKQYDVYGCGRISSWGWGTWKDRWDIYEKDYELVKKMKQTKTTSENLAMWGWDIEDVLVGNVRGTCDSWAVFWALNVISREGICINPYESLIKNIGMDGSGVHCGVTNRFEVKSMDEKTRKFDLPDSISFLDEIKKAFAPLYGSCTAVNSKSKAKEDILIYGAGNFYFQNEKAINDKYNIVAIIDKGKRGWVAGKKIIKLDEIKNYTFDYILIMVQDIQECINISQQLINWKVRPEQILLGHNLLGNYKKIVGKIMVSSDGEIRLPVTMDGITVKVRSKNEFNNVMEILADQIYHYYINNDNKDIVFDVGMKIGDSALYFLEKERVEKVYAYEPFNEPFLAAKENLQKYLNDLKKIEIFQYGISNENSKQLIDFNGNMICGQSIIVGSREEDHQLIGTVQSEDGKKEVIEFRDAAEVFQPIVLKHSDCNIILKIDCEGEEYRIIENLYKKNILDKISFIMMKWHYQGNKKILNYLKDAGFSYWCSNKGKHMGVIYAYR